MGKKEIGLRTYDGIIYLIALCMLVMSFYSDNFKKLDIKIYILFLIACIIMGLFTLNSGNVLVDLTDSIIAFIFISFGRNSALLFVIIYWAIIRLIDKNFHYKHKRGILFNVSIMIIETFLAATAMMVVSKNNLVSPYVAAIGFIAIYLLINICIFIIDTSIIEGVFVKLSRETKKLLFFNFFTSSAMAVIFSVVSSDGNYFGVISTLLVITITYMLYFLYRKLKFRSNGVKRLIKITSDIVKYGDFNEKCSHLLENLRELIPYEACAIYILGSENDSVLYPISYIAPSGIKIRDLDFNISDNSVTAQIIKEGRVYISRDSKNDKRVKISGKLKDITETSVIVPVTIGDEVIGFITIIGRRDLALFIDNGVEDILAILSNQMALAIENDSIYRSMRNAADIDYLTNLYNRRAFDRKIDELIETNSMFSMIIYDIDNFKNINDTYGHLTGDNALIEICAFIKKGIRKTDMAFRYGGEEFVVIFNDLSKEDAYTISDRIRDKIKSATFEFEGLNINITVSGGISSFPENGDTKEKLIGYADELLYNECKNKGKNRVCAYKPEDNG